VSSDGAGADGGVSGSIPEPIVLFCRYSARPRKDPAVAAVTALVTLRGCARITVHRLVAQYHHGIRLWARLCWKNDILVASHQHGDASSFRRSINSPFDRSAHPIWYAVRTSWLARILQISESARSGQAGPTCAAGRTAKGTYALDWHTLEYLSGHPLCGESVARVWITACHRHPCSLITHCPDTFPGSRSTSGHFDQSIVMVLSWAANRGSFSAPHDLPPPQRNMAPSYHRPRSDPRKPIRS